LHPLAAQRRKPNDPPVGTARLQRLQQPFLFFRGERVHFVQYKKVCFGDLLLPDIGDLFGKAGVTLVEEPLAHVGRIQEDREWCHSKSIAVELLEGLDYCSDQIRATADGLTQEEIGVGLQSSPYRIDQVGESAAETTPGDLRDHVPDA